MIKIVIRTLSIFLIISSCESDNPDLKRWVTYNDKDKILGNLVTKIICDNSNNLWFASIGVSKFDGNLWDMYGEKDGFTDKLINDIDIDRTGNLIFGTEWDGLIKYDGKKFLNLGITDYVKSLAIDSINGIWFGSSNIVYYYNGIGTTQYNLSESIGAVENEINSIFIDSKGVVWVGTDLTGIHSYNGTEWKQYVLPSNISATIFDITEDKAGNLWAVSYLSGILKFEEGKWIDLKDIAFTKPDSFNVIIVDLDNKIWVGTNNGLLMYDGKNWKTFTEADGFISTSVYSIAIDQENNVWVGTSSRVLKYLQK